MHGPAKWTYYHLYVILDIYSRYVVGWMIASHESKALAERLIAETIREHNIRRSIAFRSHFWRCGPVQCALFERKGGVHIDLR